MKSLNYIILYYIYIIYILLNIKFEKNRKKKYDEEK